MSHDPIQTASKSASELLNETLIGLRTREHRLLAFEAELKEVRRAIGVIEKAMGGGRSPARSPSRNGSGESREPGESRAKILAALEASLDPMTAQEVARAMGEKPAGWISMALTRLVRAGTIASYAGERYGVKARNGSEPDEDDESLEAAVLDAAGIEPGEEA